MVSIPSFGVKYFCNMCRVKVCVYHISGCSVLDDWSSACVWWPIDRVGGISGCEQRDIDWKCETSEGGERVHGELLQVFVREKCNKNIAKKKIKNGRTITLKGRLQKRVQRSSVIWNRPSASEKCQQLSIVNCCKMDRAHKHCTALQCSNVLSKWSVENYPEEKSVKSYRQWRTSHC